MAKSILGGSWDIYLQIEQGFDFANEWPVAAQASRIDFAEGCIMHKKE